MRENNEPPKITAKVTSRPHCVISFSSDRVNFKSKAIIAVTRIAIIPKMASM
jgi:hypothetical protein